MSYADELFRQARELMLEFVAEGGIPDEYQRLWDQQQDAIPRAREAALRERGKDALVVIPGKHVFDLAATHGLPVEIQIDVAADKGAMCDIAGYWHHLQEHRARSRAASSMRGLRTGEGEEQQ
ncbi:MAG: alanine--tRNA ligase-related protein [Armatimonadota bacterium]|nr:alanine--tRNA ligase-related protein [Armatimonadota bacterium]